MASTKMEVKENNNSLELIRIMNEIGKTEAAMTRLMNCSNVFNLWINGYRIIPKSFRRFLLALLFIHREGKTAEFESFARKEERKRGW